MSEAEQRLDEIRARCEAASPGPWGWSDDPEWRRSEHVETVYSRRGEVGLRASNDAQVIDADPSDGEYPWALDATGEDADFIAHARDDIPYLLALLDAERARVDRLKRDLVDEWQSNHAERCANMDPFHDRGGVCCCELPESVTEAEARAILAEREAKP